MKSAASHCSLGGKGDRCIKRDGDFGVGWSLRHVLWNEGLSDGQEKVDISSGTCQSKRPSKPRVFTSRTTHLTPTYKPSCNLLVMVSKTGKLT